MDSAFAWLTGDVAHAACDVDRVANIVELRRTAHVPPFRLAVGELHRKGRIEWNFLLQMIAQLPQKDLPRVRREDRAQVD